MKIALLGLALLLGVAAAPPGPVLTGRVVDEAHILPAPVAARLVRKLADYERRTRHQLLVVTVASLSGQSIDAFGLALARRWGIGRKSINDGLILLVAPNERKVRIEVGLGLERRMTNERAGAIIRTVLIPAFRRGDLPRGIEAGTDAIIAAVPD